jgi:hypothetical protein
MTVTVTKEHENAYTSEYKDIEYLGAHFQVKMFFNSLLVDFSNCLT